MCRPYVAVRCTLTKTAFSVAITSPSRGVYLTDVLIPAIESVRAPPISVQVLITGQIRSQLTSGLVPTYIKKCPYGLGVAGIVKTELKHGVILS